MPVSGKHRCLFLASIGARADFLSRQTYRNSINVHDGSCDRQFVCFKCFLPHPTGRKYFVTLQLHVQVVVKYVCLV